MELYGRVRKACLVDGLSRREAAKQFGIDRQKVSKMLEHSVPQHHPDSCEHKKGWQAGTD